MSTETPAVTLEQWRALLAVVDAGGYAQAAAAMHKSQSAITYAVQKIEALLGVDIFVLAGRKAVLTEGGEVLVRRARALLEEAVFLERGAQAMAADWKPELKLAVNVVFPTQVLLQSLKAFARHRPETRVELYEFVLSPEEALFDGRADLAIVSTIPPGFAGELIARIQFVAVASPRHPLHHLGRLATLRDLRRHRQVVLRDSGVERKKSSGWLGAEQRWTVSNLATSIEAVCQGLGFAWLPEAHVRDRLETGQLHRLRLGGGGERFVDLFLAYREEMMAIPDVRYFAGLLLGKKKP